MSKSEMKDAELERYAQEYFNILVRTYNEIEMANMPYLICTNSFKAGARYQAEKMQREIEEARELCALMSDGEGSDVEVYRRMANQAMKLLDFIRSIAPSWLPEGVRDERRALLEAFAAYICKGEPHAC